VGLVPGLSEAKAAESLDFLDRAIYDLGGPVALKQALTKVRQSAKKIQEAIAYVPEDWWTGMAVAPAEVKETLERRLYKLDNILDLKKWEGLHHATRGGHIL
jgi:hypothetical protein